jgi:ketosteroid isomerase-like protein
MSENAERARAGWEFFNLTRQIDVSMLHPDIVWHAREDLPDARTYHGHDGIAELLAHWDGAFEDFGVVVEEVIEAGDLIVTVLLVHGRIRGSDQRIEMSETHVARWHDGKVVEVYEYPIKAAALEAFGMAQ